jgi:transposase-like protein
MVPMSTCYGDGEVFAEQLMGADADAVCGADYGERSPERVNRRNGYRERAWDTRAGTIALQVPKLREGTYFPEWLLEPRRRAERAFVQVGLPPVQLIQTLRAFRPHERPRRWSRTRSG